MNAGATAFVAVIAYRTVKEPSKLPPTGLEQLLILECAHRPDDNMFHGVALVRQIRTSARVGNGVRCYNHAPILPAAPLRLAA